MVMMVKIMMVMMMIIVTEYGPNLSVIQLSGGESLAANLVSER